MGYAGGRKKDPTYHDIGDHAETVRVDFNPKRITYDDLLDIFWKAHDPTQAPFSTQYMAAVFFYNQDQKGKAYRSLEKIQARLKSPIQTRLLPVQRFNSAEAYHQKYFLRQNRLISDDFFSIYPEGDQFIDSTAAARVNGYLGGFGCPDQLVDELGSLGLSRKAREKLAEIVSKNC